jgi:hypothetical protein
MVQAFKAGTELGWTAQLDLAAVGQIPASPSLDGFAKTHGLENRCVG